MSGNPYGNPAGGYPPQYGGGYSGYQPPPPVPNYNDNQSCASLYGTPGPAPSNNNYASGPYDAYGGNQMPNAAYGMGAGSSYPPAPYDSYGGNQMPDASYGMGGGSNYPPPPPSGGNQMPNASYGMGSGSNYPPPPSGGQMAPPPQQFGGKTK
jgi:hypothetical protein